MTDATTYTEEQVIGRMFENVDADASPATTYVALWTTDPANSPDPANEVSGDSYSPLAVDNSSGEWQRDSTGGPTQVSNSIELDFGVLDTSSQVNVEGIVVYDGSDTSTANALVKASNISEVVDSGNELRIPVGDATFSLD
mgnify:CR=1 FL=1